MTAENPSHINQLMKDLPEGLFVDAAWLERRGIASNLRAYYVKSGWLVQPARGLYRRQPSKLIPQRGTLSWQQAVISMQHLLGLPFFVGGRTALELQGHAHYLSQDTRAVHLYGRIRPPGWLAKLALPQRFVCHNSATLFRNDPVSQGPGSLQWNTEDGTGQDLTQLRGGGQGGLWGEWDWPMTLSRPERAFLEMLDELPKNETFHQADMIAQGAANFSPRLLGKLLAECRSVKVKRLFFFFADRHRHAWRQRLDPRDYDLGPGKRMLVRGGRLDPAYQITVPGDLDADP